MRPRLHASVGKPVGRFLIFLVAGRPTIDHPSGWSFYLHLNVVLRQKEIPMPNTAALTKEFSLKILSVLKTGARRFCQIEQMTAAKNPIYLSRILKKLVRDGIITRTVITLGPPARIKYQLTQIGLDLINPELSRAAWNNLHQDHIADARQASNAAKAAKRAQALLADNVAP
jgi:DNA-binding HxlR family transcriptional regulator